MARIARVVVPGLPHHITQRGNRGQRTFFTKDDYRAYLELMAESCDRCKVVVWAYCLMPNHVHLIVVPKSKDGLARAIGETHRRYARRVNSRQGWRGHLWQGRLASFVMDDPTLLACARYVERNPVRAGPSSRPQDYAWSSAAAHLARKDDVLVQVRPLLKRVPRWAQHLSADPDAETMRRLRLHESTGRPLGSERFLKRLEKLLGRTLRPGKPGRKKKTGKK